MAKHTHQWQPLSISLDASRPNVLYGCQTCIQTEVNCLLCQMDGNRRRHKRKHDPVEEYALLNLAKLELTKVVLIMERLWGPYDPHTGRFGSKGLDRHAPSRAT